MSFIESELKLRLTDPAQATLLLEELQNLAAGFRGKSAWREDHLQSTYYDTPSHQLLSAGLSYRLRQARGKVTATVKADGQSDGGLHQRLEFNVGMDGATPDIAPFLSTQIGERLKGAVGSEELIPMFGSDVVRRTVNLAWRDGSEIEAALDCGEILAGEKTESVCELELELVKGSAKALLELGAELALKFPLLIELESKLSRAVKLAKLSHYYPDERQREPSAAEFKKETPLFGLSKITIFLLHSLLNTQQEFLARHESVPQFHQLRISLRKLRSFFLLFKTVLPEEEFKRWQTALKNLWRHLGELRDWDALLENWQKLEVSCLGCQQAQEMAHPLPEVLKEERKKEALKVKAHLEKGESASVFLGLWAYLLGQMEKDADAGTAATLEKFAQDSLKKQVEELQTFGDKITVTDLREAHALRIRVKKLRYTMHILEPVLPKGTPDFLEKLKVLQDNLGVIGESELAFAKINEILKPYSKRPLYYDAGLLTASIAQTSQKARKDFARLWRKARKTSRKWLEKT